jgi:hypothetical protein
MCAVPKLIFRVPRTIDRSAPDLSAECPDDVDAALRDRLRHALRERHALRLGVDAHGVDEVLDVDAMVGPAAAVAVVVSGTARRAHEVFVFARSPDDDERGDVLDGALGVVVDYLDAVLEELVGAEDAFLPLDWEGRHYEHHGRRVVVFVRGEVRDYVAEEDAATLLQEPAAPRAIEGFPPR